MILVVSLAVFIKGLEEIQSDCFRASRERNVEMELDLLHVDITGLCKHVIIVYRAVVVAP